MLKNLLTFAQRSLNVKKAAMPAALGTNSDLPNTLRDLGAGSWMFVREKEKLS